MNLLQIYNKLRPNIRASGGNIATVVGQTGEIARGISWVIDAYSDLQLRYDDWLWLRSRFSVNTVSGTDTYAYGACTDTRLTGAITRFQKWIILDDRGYSNITRYLTSVGVAGETYLTYLPWADFRFIYKRGVQSTRTGVPIHFTVDPQKQLVIGPIPNDVYTVRGEYQMAPQTLALDADTPEMPAQFHDLIWYRAMEKYAVDLVAPEKMERAEKEGRRIMRALESNQRNSMSVADPLV